MGIWDSLRRFTRPSKINSGRRYHSEDSQPAHTKKRGLRLEQFEERMLLSISPSGLDSETLWKHALSLAVEQAGNLDNYSEEALATTDSWVVGLTDSTVAKQLAAALGADQLGEAQYLDEAYIWQFSASVGWESVANMLGSVETVDYFYPLVPEQYESNFAPNDPLYPDQWHLNNTGQSGGTVGADANVELAWDLYDGSGVVIGIVDDGLQYTHPDLTGNYRADLSYDFADYDADPAPFTDAAEGYDDDSHGTSVAGVAAAQGNNSIGVSGVAPGAELAGLRLDFITGMITDAEQAAALSYANDEIDIYNNSWGPVNLFVAPGPQAMAALYNGVTNGRDGLGSIYVCSAGNSAQSYDNVNYSGFANSRFTIAVGALDHDGVHSYYSEPGASLLISAYSNGWVSGITTTDLLGTDGYNYIDDATDGDALDDLDYNSTFGGTSSAAPLVSGVIALILEANPNLTYRDVQHILVESAAMTDATNSDWVINGGGYHVNHEYGFGAIDAAAAVELAANWENVAEEQWMTSGRMTVNQAIPDSSVSSVSSTVTMDSDIGSIEWVEVVFDADHTYSGDLEIILTSPSGTESVLATVNPSTTQYDNWTFTSARHWGETSAGDWTLTVRDAISGDTGTFEAWELNIYGTQAGVAPELVAVLPNSGELILGGEVLEIAPRELTLRFSEGQVIDVNSLQWTDTDGQTQSPIQIVRAGDDGQFGTADDVEVEFGWIGRGDEDGGRENEIIVRFAETLPDDLYQLRIVGSGDHPLRNNYGIPFRDGGDFTTEFELDLGAQVTAVVPQPITRDASGNLSQARNQIDVYFNNDDLNEVAAMTEEFYTLFYTNDTATDADDPVVSLHPIKVNYDATADKVELIFEKDLADDEYGTGAVRLRIGTEYKEIDTKWHNLSDDPADTFTDAEDLGNLGMVTGETLIIAAEIEPVVAYELTWPGALDEPGHRELPGPYGLMDVDIEDHLLSHFGADVVAGIPTFAYNFNENYGALPGSGIPSNLITEAQKDLVRQIFDLYGYYLGVQFVETDAAGINIAVGDLRAQGYESGPGGVAGLGAYGMFALMDAAEEWESTFGGNFFFVAMHEIGHALGLGHTYDLPAGTVMGNESFYGGTEYYDQLFEAIWPAAADIIHGQYIYRPDSNDIDLYKFVPDKTGRFSAETIAERLDSSSSLDTVISLFDGATGEVIARNDDYFSEDSYLEFELEAGKTYFIGVSASGNDDYDPNIEDSGIGGTTQGEYELRLTFVPDADAGQLVDATDTPLDGDADGIAGGEYNFWFDVQKTDDTLYVDKAATGGTGALGSIDNPYTTIDDALAAAGDGDIVRIVGNGGADGRLSTTDDNLAYEIGVGKLNRVLEDGETMEIPKGVTVMIDAGAIFKLRKANIDVGSSAQGIDRSEGALQVLGTPENSVIFTSYYDESLGVDTEPLTTTPFAGDWGGLVFRNDLDYDELDEGRTVLEREGIFLNYVNHADIRYGGGTVTVNSESSPYYPIHMIEARPTVTYNTITNSAHAALSADPNSFMESKYYGDTYTLDYDRVGPDMYGNRLIDNSINGIYVRIQTDAGSPIDELEVAGRFDDLDMVHVVLEDLIISGTPGGSIVEAGRVPLSMVGFAMADLASVVDGYTFSVSNGSDEMVFEFEDTAIGDGVPTGHVAVPFTTGDSVPTIAAAIEAAIEAQSRLGISVELTPDSEIALNGPMGTTLTPLVAPLASLGKAAFAVLDASYPMDGYQFEISDGNNTLTFEFENADVGDGVDGMFTIPVSYTPGTDTASSIAQAIVDLVNFAYSQGFEVFAEVADNQIWLHPATTTTTLSYQFDPVTSPFGTGTVLGVGSTRSDVDWSLDMADGQTFEVFDGVQRVVFEFDDTVEGDGVEAGHIAVPYRPNYYPAQIAAAVVTAINDARADNPYLNVQASIMPGSTTLIKLTPVAPSTEITVDLSTSPNARLDGRLRIDEGMIIKLDGTRIETEIGSQLLAEGSEELPIVFTSLSDDRYGAGGTFDTINDNENVNPSTPTPGDWGGLFFGVTSSGSVDYARIYFGGGETRVEGGYGQFNPIEIHQAEVRVTNTFFNQNLAGASGGVSGSGLEDMFEELGTEADPENGALLQGVAASTIPDRVGRGTTEPATIFVRGAQPVIAGNVFVSNAGSSISIDANSMTADYQVDWGRSTGAVDTFDEYNDNYGPLVRDNRLADNQTNGMEIRGAVLTVESIWDDTDIVHVLRSEITVPNYHHEGGLLLQSNDAGSLVVKLDGDDAGFTAAGKPQEIDDRIGGTVQIIGTPNNPVILTALADDTVGAGFDPWDRPQYNTDNVKASPTEGAWRSIKLEEYSNDRNVAVINEQEDAYAAEDENGLNAQGKPATAEYLGALAADIEGGDDNLRLGFEVNGFINFDDATDVDVYYFQATAGTEIWIDIDETRHSLDTIVELIDANGNVIASSDNSYDDTEAAGGDGDLAGDALRMDRDIWDDDPNTDLQRDFYTTNQRDAGFRVVLPGTTGQTRLYYVKVSSKQITNGVAENASLDSTSGGYQLQVRLKEEQEVAGSTIRYADIRYATNGIEVNGLPTSSPLLVETSDVDQTGGSNNTSSTAQDIGNLLESNNNAIEVAGYLGSASDVDWYSFDVDYTGMLVSGSVFPTVFDIDYADGMSRPNATIWVFDSTGRLVLVSQDSNIVDDQRGEEQGSSVDDLSRGSFGFLDPYIGTQYLPEGDNVTYYVAVTGPGMTANAVLDQPLLRLEPIDSVARVVEDHIGADDGDSLVADDSQTLNLTPVEFHLGDVVMYINTGNDLYTADPFTGAIETDVTGAGQGLPDWLTLDYNDIAMRNDGRVYTFTGRTNSNATTGQYRQIDTGDGSLLSSQDDGIITYEVVPGDPPTLVETNVGIEFQALEHTDSTYNGRLIYAVGNANPAGVGVEYTDNLLYVFDSDGNPIDHPSPLADGSERITTNIVPKGMLITGSYLELPDATDTDGDYGMSTVSVDDILDATRFTIEYQGNTYIFELDCGPDIRLDPDGPRAFRDGDTFTLGSTTFEFSSGPVLVIDNVSSLDGAIFEITADGQTEPVIFEFDSDGDVVDDDDNDEPDNGIIEFTTGQSIQVVMNSVIAAVSAAQGLTATGFVDDGGAARISFEGDVAFAATGLTVEGDYALLDANNVSIDFEETMDEEAFGQLIVDVVNAAMPYVDASYAHVPDDGTDTHGDRITFSGATSFDFTTIDSRTPEPMQLVYGRHGDLSATGRSTGDGVNADFLVEFGAGDSSGDIQDAIIDVIEDQFAGVEAKRQGTLLVVDGANFVDGDHPLDWEVGGPGGDITGLAFIDGTLYAVSDRGGVFEVLNLDAWGFTPVNPEEGYNYIVRNDSGPSLQYIGLVSSPAGTAATLSGAARGPENVENAFYSQMLFATDYSGNLYAIDPADVTPDQDMVLQPIFVDGATSVNLGISDVRGIDFTPVDYNLWHQTLSRQSDDGHGIETTFDDTRTNSVGYPIDGGTSYWFGLQDPRPANEVVETQPGVGNFIDESSDKLDTYDVPGGAYGSLVSDTFSLAGYASADQPVLYFNYYCETENSNNWDAARVYITNDGVNWHLLATNTDLDAQSVNNYVEGAEIIDEGVYWRQVRVELSEYAGMDSLQLRFDFNTASDTQTGDIWLTGTFLGALSGQELADGDSFEIDGTTFEFDMGIGLLMPNVAGQAIEDGSYFDVTDTHGNTVRFEFDKNNSLVNPTAVAVEISDTMLSGEVANVIEAAINDEVTAGSLVDVVADALDSADYPTTAPAQEEPFEYENRVMLHGALSVGQSAEQPFRDDSRADDPALADWVLGIQGNGSGVTTGVPVPITQGMSAEDVAEVIGDVLDDFFSAADVTGLYTSCKVAGDVVQIIGHEVTDSGVLPFNDAMASDLALENPIEKSWLIDRFRSNLRGQNNNYEGFYIDDIIIGFAERGEMVTSSTPDTTFVAQSFNPLLENSVGSYQLEIRRGSDYGLKPVPFSPPDWVGLLDAFDTNERLNHSVTLIAPKVDEIQHGMTFALSDGVNEVTFEFIAENIGGGGINGVPIVFGGWESPGELANLIAVAINAASGFDVYASSIETSERIDLFNLANYSVDEDVFGVIVADQDGLGESTGDENSERDQGYLIIESNTISYSAGYGIVVDAGARDTDANWAHPSSAAPLSVTNVDQLVPGIMIQNNVLNQGGSGGILFSGDTQPDGQPTAAVPFGRIVNNTIYGRGSTTTTEYGIKVEENAGPTLLNNIVANVTVGIGVDDSSLSTTVIGSTLYKDIYNNQYAVNTDTNTAIDPGEFPLMLDSDDPLFVNAAAGNFYLDADSLAIDSSVDSLQERESLAVVLDPMGLDPSPILAPERDLYGQLRVDDPGISPPVGMGTLVYKDRGAIDRVDRDGPTARLINPEDDDAAGLDHNSAAHDVAVTGQTLFEFTIELSDTGGVGIDDSTVYSQQVEVYRDDVLLVEEFDYLYQYDAVNDCIHLFPAAGIWQEGYIYTIKLNNDPETGIRDLANNPLEANRSDGEVRFEIALAAVDFGDAPDPTYPSTLDNDGARHVILGGYYLGSGVSGENDTRQNALAGGDSFDDGVVFDAGLWAGHASALTVTASREGKLDAWIDFNGDGVWDVDEKVFDSIDLVAGENTLSIDVPSTAAIGWTFGRFRFSAEGGLDVTGEANNGEVEDYRIRVVDVYEDYGDAPAPFPTMLADGGASHAIGGPLYLGQGVDFEFDGQPNSAATGDDSDGNDDEDGVRFVTPPVSGADAEVVVTASVAGGYLNAWVDFNLDGDWDDAGEQIFDGVALAAGDNSLTFSVPATMQEGDQPYARFRVSSDQNLGYSGAAADGEVEDYRLSIVSVPEDFGDAPMPYPTTLINSGARHTIVAGFHLGASVDYEVDGQPNATATGDDVTDNDDEDGVVFSGNLIPQTEVTVTVSTVNTSADLSEGYLNVWIDFNRDGDWDDAGEHVFVDQLLDNNASTDLALNVPADVVAGETFARFRYSHTAGLSYNGPASSEDAPDGEVEDYQVTIEVGDASISGWKFNDLNGDGIWNSNAGTREPGLAGVTVFLDANANGVHDTGEPTTVTTEDDPATLNVDETGYYEFAGLFAGQYRVYEVIPETWDPSDWIQTTPTMETDSLPTGVTVGQYTDAGQDRYYYAVDLEAGTTLEDMNFGNLQQGHITITDVAIAEGNEGTTEVTITIELTDAFYAPIEVTYATADGLGANAATVADNDYVPASGTIEFNPVGTPSPTWDVLTLTSNSTNDYDYHVSGSLVVWEEYDGADWEIYLYDHEKFLELQQEDAFTTPADATVRVTVNNGYDRHVAVAGDKVVWAGQGGDGDYEIFLFDYGQYKAAGDSAVVNNFVDQLTNNTYDDMNPEVSDLGITWWADMPTDQEIFYYDFAAAAANSSYKAVNISNNATDDFEPRISGDRVVWHGYNTTTNPKDENLEIFFYDANTGVTQQLTSNSSEDRRPRIDGDQIVWQGKVGEDWEIFRYDIAAAASNTAYQPVNISNHDGDDINPEVSGGQVVWQGYVTDYIFVGYEQSDYEIFLYDVEVADAVGSYEAVQVTDNAVTDEMPRIEGNRLVWRNYTADDWDVMYAEIGALFGESNVSDSTAYDWPAQVSDSLIVWRSRDSEDYEIMIATQNEPVTTMTFTVLINGDFNVEDDENFLVKLTGATFAEIDSDQAVVWILNDDGQLDYGDAPASYDTLLDDNGARHVTGSGVYLGERVDAEGDGRPNLQATGDDTWTSDDEDGIVFETALVPGEIARLSVTASTGGYLNAWLDFNSDGTFADYDVLNVPESQKHREKDEQIAWSTSSDGSNAVENIWIEAGTTELYFLVPEDAVVDGSYARFRFSSEGNLTFIGNAADGEVEDYAVTISPIAQVVDNELHLVGTDGDDTFEFTAGATAADWVVKVNGVEQIFPDTVEQIFFDGREGNDQVTLIGTAGADTAVLEATAAELSGSGYAVFTTNVENPTVYGRAGEDTITFYDNAGRNQFVAGRGFAGYLTGFAGELRSYEFELVTAYAGDGIDEAKLYDSAGDDVFVSDPNVSVLTGGGMTITVHDFQGVHAYATLGGVDKAYFTDTALDDQVIGTHEYAIMWSPNYEQGVFNRSKFFEESYAVSSHGGADIVKFYDGPGDDAFVADEHEASFTCVNKYTTSSVFVEDFVGVHAFASTGTGYDTATFYDSTGNDEYYSDAVQAALWNTTAGWYNRAKFFERTDAYATAGGTDKATLVDSTFDDNLLLDANSLTIYGADNGHHFGTSFRNRIELFDTVYAKSIGGTDVLELEDSNGADTLEATGHQLSFFSAEHNLDYVLEDIAQTTAKTDDNNTDTRKVLDYLFDIDFEGNWKNL